MLPVFGAYGSSQALSPPRHHSGPATAQRICRPNIPLLCPNHSPNNSTFVNDGVVQWHGEAPLEPDWSESSRLVAYTLSDGRGGGLYVAFNTSHKPK